VGTLFYDIKQKDVEEIGFLSNFQWNEDFYGYLRNEMLSDRTYPLSRLYTVKYIFSQNPTLTQMLFSKHPSFYS
jgi:hypothetical protein